MIESAKVPSSHIGCLSSERQAGFGWRREAVVLTAKCERTGIFAGAREEFETHVKALLGRGMGRLLGGPDSGSRQTIEHALVTSVQVSLLANAVGFGHGELPALAALGETFESRGPYRR